VDEHDPRLYYVQYNLVQFSSYVYISISKAAPCMRRCICVSTRAFVDISPISQPNRALSALSYGLKPNCNLSQLCHGHMPIACTHTTGNLLRSQYTQGCNQCEDSYTQVYQHLNARQLHINAPYKHLSVIVSTSHVGRTT
jgi:hypothetical protein